jgi:hypothetical protein
MEQPEVHVVDHQSPLPSLPIGKSQKQSRNPATFFGLKWLTGATATNSSSFDTADTWKDGSNFDTTSLMDVPTDSSSSSDCTE